VIDGEEKEAVETILLYWMLIWLINEMKLTVGFVFCTSRLLNREKDTKICHFFFFEFKF